MSSGSNAKHFFIGDWRVTPALDELSRATENVKIEPRLMRLLALLASRAGEVVTIEQILESVWPGVVVTQSSVYNSVASLRKLLGDVSDETRYIATVSRRGYRLIAPVVHEPTSGGMSRPDGIAFNAVVGWPDGAPTAFDGLQVLRLIGEGASGQVFLAKEIALERLVAVKLLRPALIDNANARARFQRESLAAARIRHPNVATIYRVGEISGEYPYIASEYIEGRTLAEMLLLDGVCTLDDGIHILGSLAEALNAADDKRIIHRDLKPENVLIERHTKRVVLTDFGVAGLQDSGRDVHKLTRANEVLGDPRYTSPEHVRGEALASSSDIYSLGVLGLELLSGRPAYAATTPQEIAHAHVAGEPIDLRSVRPEIPASLHDLLRRCVAKKSTERPTAADLVRLLRAVNGAPEAKEARHNDARLSVSPKSKWAVGAILATSLLALLAWWANS